MKNDLRRQTFSKPDKPSAEEIKRLTDDETALPPKRETKTSVKAAPKTEDAESDTNGAVKNGGNDKQAQPASSHNASSNPFLLSRGQTSSVGVEKTGYRLRSDYMDLLKLVKRMKKGHTLEAVLDDALTFYFENSEDGRKAVKHRQMLENEF